MHRVLGVFIFRCVTHNHGQNTTMSFSYPNFKTANWFKNDGHDNQHGTVIFLGAFL